MRKALLAIASVMALATAASPASAIQCVPYAREISGINLKGDAWQWWNAAAGQYERGNAPRGGAVLVFNRQGSMSHGHVSVVTRVLNSRTILVDHANWAPARTSGRGAVSTSVPLIDVSPKNDWTQVRVWYQPTRDYGTRVYRTEGFVYRPRSNDADRSGLQLAAMGRSVPLQPQDTIIRKIEPATAKPVSVTAPVAKPQHRPATLAQPVAVKAETAAPLAASGPVGKMEDAVSAAKSIYQDRTPAKASAIFN